jgi:hypothetical protein
MTTRSQPGLLPGFLLMRVRRQKIGASRDLPAPSILQRRSACGPLRHRGFSTILKLVCGGMLPGSIVRIGLPQYAEEISPKGRKHCPCGKELIDINSRGEILTGCSRCNVWWQPNKPPVRLSEEDLLALHTRGAERLQKRLTSLGVTA